MSTRAGKVPSGPGHRPVVGHAGTVAGVLRFLAGLAAAIVLTGCAGSPAQSAPPSTASVAIATTPADSVTLSDLGLKYGPTALFLPSGIELTDQIDAQNNVTAVVVKPTGVELAEYLRQHLPASGFTVSADRNGALLFEGWGWEGAFIVSGDTSALTLRNDR